MPTFTQAGRPIAVSTPLGADAVLLHGFTGTEAISAPFRFHLDLLAPASSPIHFAALLGQPATISLMQADGSSRPFNGIVVRLSEGPRLPGAGGSGTFLRYSAELAPRFWLLKLRVQSRIFQQITVPDILTKVLTGITVDNQIQGPFDPRDYCVQYRESDFDFACRLMEEEGIFYYFTHSASGHTMVLDNTPQAYGHLAGASTIKYEPLLGGTRTDERIYAWEKSQEIRPGKYTLWDYCFELPGNNLAVSQPTMASVQVGKVSHSLAVGGNDQLEVYEYPGGFARRYDGISPGGADQASDLQKIFQDNARTVAIRMQQEAALGVEIAGESNARQLAAGGQFVLSGHFDGDGEYVLTRVEHAASLPGAYLQDDAADGSTFSYTNTFRCMPLALPFRPPRTTPQPRIDGTQTAIVVGPQGQEIFTDKYGRVKVQFLWDRAGTNDANSSCWVRVASSWSGQQWGFIQIPRIGQEVVVSFEEGDPDQPIITGSVYNAATMPPYTLPDHMTQSGVVSRSSPQADSTNFNHIVFEDKKGSELISVHAERDHARVVENNDALTVGSSDSKTCPEGNQTISVYKDRTTTIETGNESLTVKKGNRSVTVSEGDDSHTVTKGKRTVTVESDDAHEVKTGNRTVTVNTGNDTHTVKTGNREVDVNTGNDTHNIKTGNRQVTISLGNDTLEVKVGNQSTKISVGSSTTEALQGITLKCGGNSIVIGPAGITIKGITVSIEGQAQAQVKAPICQVSGDGMLMMKGGITMIN